MITIVAATCVQSALGSHAPVTRSNEHSIRNIDEEFEKLLHNEVNLRLPKEVIFSTPLSGGIDSTILVNVIKKTIKNTI